MFAGEKGEKFTNNFVKSDFLKYQNLSISEHLVQLLKKKKIWIFFVKNIFFLNISLEKIFLTKSFVNFSPFSPANMVPASGGHLSEGWNHAGLFSFDLILSELLLEHDIFKIDFISWAPSGEVWQYPHPCPWPIACGHTRDGPGSGGGLLLGLCGEMF